MSVRMIEGGIVRFTKCAVINCTLSIYSIGLSMTFLLLGEVGGVRVFPLRPLIKGKSAQGASSRDIGSTSNLCHNKLPNGVVVPVRRGKKGLSSGELHEARIHRYNGGRDDADNVPGRHKTAKLWQNSDDCRSIFIEIRCDDVQKAQSSMGALASVKAVTIRELSLKTFLILDSVGDVHLLNMHNTIRASEVSRHSFINSKDAEICRLSYMMKVQMLAVLPDISNKTPVIWISDGGYSVHMVSVVDMESPANESQKDTSEEKAIQISAMQAIFTSDKVQDVVPLSANAVLVLGKGNIFSYAMA